MFENHPATRFPTTHGRRIARAGGQADAAARAALEGLCRDYWFPLYAFARRRGSSPHEAEDVVQGFLADLPERGALACVRELEALARLPQGERKNWQAFWAGAADLLKRAE